MRNLCDVVVIGCVDFRLHTAIGEFLARRGLRGKYDLITRPGAAKDLILGNEAEKASLLRHIEICWKVHEIRDVFIIQHTDCAALGGREAFPGPTVERQELVNIMEKSRQIINKTFNYCLGVNRVIAHIDDSGAITFEELD